MPLRSLSGRSFSLRPCDQPVLRDCNWRVIECKQIAKRGVTMGVVRRFLGAVFCAIVLSQTCFAQIFPDLGRLVMDPSRLRPFIEPMRPLPWPPGQQPPPQAEAPHKVVFQYGLSSALVGRSPAGGTVGFRHVLLVMVPVTLSPADEQAVRKAVPGIVEAQATVFRNALDSQQSVTELSSSKASMEEAVNATLKDSLLLTNSQFIHTVRAIQRGVTVKLPRLAPSVIVGIAVKPCDAPQCKLDAFATVPGNRSFHRYAKLHEWMKAKSMPGTNQPFILDLKSVPENVSDLVGLAPAKFLTTKANLDKGFSWQQPLPAEHLQATFVIAANQARKANSQLSYVSAELVGLSFESSSHLADIFDSAYAAGGRLKSDPAAKLKGISDEHARARLKECVGLRGTFDAVTAGECAGLKMTDALVSQCMAGKECFPDFGSKVNPGALLATAKSALTNAMATGGALPRIGLGSVDEIKTAAASCAAQHKTEDAAAYCLVKSKLSKSSADQIGCIESQGKNGSLGMMRCASAGLSSVQKTQLACLESFRNEAKNLALCTGLASLPPAAQRLVDCASRTGAKVGSLETLACASAVPGSPEAACLSRYPKELQKAALCMSAGSLPAPVQAGLACAQQSSSATDFGICMAASQGSGDAQRIAACYLEGQGHPAAIAICLAAPNLTVDQRIALQCAVQTNGAPPAFAACTAGKLATKELINCRGQRFAEGKCFGETNDLRKLSKQLGVEIGPNSVAAQMANVQLQVVDFGTRPLVDALPKVVEFYEKLPPSLKPRDPTKHPEDVVLPPGVPSVVEDFCAHNPCPKF